jgi:hypothetical protein
VCSEVVDAAWETAAAEVTEADGKELPAGYVGIGDW